MTIHKPFRLMCQGLLAHLKCFYGLEIFSNPLINVTTKRFNKSRSKKMERKPNQPSWKGETLKLKDNQNRPVVASFNQINGFFVVVEQVSNAKNELMLKTMYKARENYKDSLTYKKTLAKYQNSN